MKKIIKILNIAVVMALALMLLSSSVLATDTSTTPSTPGNSGGTGGGFSSSNIATGTQNLISDVSTWMIGISLAVGSAAAIYCLIRRSMADEADGKMWNKRCVTAIVCAVGGALVGGIISLIASYF